METRFSHGHHTDHLIKCEVQCGKIVTEKKEGRQNRDTSKTVYHKNTPMLRHAPLTALVALPGGASLSRAPRNSS